MINSWRYIIQATPSHGSLTTPRSMRVIGVSTTTNDTTIQVPNVSQEDARIVKKSKNDTIRLLDEINFTFYLLLARVVERLLDENRFAAISLLFYNFRARFGTIMGEILDNVAKMYLATRDVLPLSRRWPSHVRGGRLWWVNFCSSDN